VVSIRLDRNRQRESSDAPVAAMYDWAANPCGIVPVTEGGGNDVEF